MPFQNVLLGRPPFNKGVAFSVQSQGRPPTKEVAFVPISSTRLPGYTGPLCYRVNQVAAATGLCRSQIYNLMRSGELPFIELGKTRLIRADDLRKLLQIREPAE
jgi:excisionase family DNA binding protein